MTYSGTRSAAILLGVLASAGCAHRGGSGTTGPEPLASGTLRNAAGEPVGLVTLTDTAGTLRLGVSAASLTPGPHGFHIHAQGTCTPPDFASAGAHFNPGGRKHGRLNPEGAHAGDLPNLVVGANGSVDTSFTVPSEVTVAGPASLLQAGGTALVIHASPDDERTDPSGNSGTRVACAVLERG